MNRRSLLAAGASALAFPARGEPTTLVPVLTYHRFDPLQARSATIVTTSVFAEQMDHLANSRIRVAPLREVLGFARGTAPSGPTVAITADDGWRSVHAEMFPIIQRHRFPITLFLNPPMIGVGSAYLTWPMIVEMLKSGLVDVQPHTQSHPNFNTERARRDPVGFQTYVLEQIAGSRRDITRKLELPADILAWPFGIHDTMLEASAATAGCIAAFALGGRAVTSGDPAFALPRYQVYDTDRAGRFAAVASGQPRQPSHAKAPS